jgi:DNA-binding response OmpR family regulator
MKKILVVDDEPDTVEFLKRSLERNNFDTISAGNGEEGLRRALQEKPDLIILDLLMPNKDGFTILQELKNNESTRGIPVIVLSAKPESTSIFKGWDYGAIDYIIKPCDFQTILRYIKRYI